MNEKTSLHQNLEELTTNLTTEVSKRYAYLELLNNRPDRQEEHKAEIAQDIIDTYKERILAIGQSALGEFLNPDFNEQFMEAMTCLGCLSTDTKNHPQSIELMELALLKNPDLERRHFLHIRSAEIYFELSENDPAYLPYCKNHLTHAVDTIYTHFLEEPSTTLIEEYLYHNIIPLDILCNTLWEFDKEAYDQPLYYYTLLGYIQIRNGERDRAIQTWDFISHLQGVPAALKTFISDNMDAPEYE